MAFKRPPPPDLEPQWHDLRDRAEKLRGELNRLLDDCDRFLRRCRLASLTHKEAVAEYLEQRPGRTFGSRQIQKALEADGMAFSQHYTVSAMLTRLQDDGRVVQVSHGKWTSREPGCLATGQVDGSQGSSPPVRGTEREAGID